MCPPYTYARTTMLPIRTSCPVRFHPTHTHTKNRTHFAVQIERNFSAAVGTKLFAHRRTPKRFGAMLLMRPEPEHAKKIENTARREFARVQFRTPESGAKTCVSGSSSSSTTVRRIMQLKSIPASLVMRSCLAIVSVNTPERSGLIPRIEPASLWAVWWMENHARQKNTHTHREWCE